MKYPDRDLEECTVRGCCTSAQEHTGGSYISIA
jgi:hypothetical protein